MPNYQKAYWIGKVNEQGGDEQRGSAEPFFRKDESGNLFLGEKDWQEAKQNGAFNVVYFERLSRSRVLVDAAGKEVIEYPYLIDSALEGPMETYRHGERTVKDGQIIGRQPIRRFLPDPLPELEPVVLLSAGTRWDYNRPPLEIYEQIKNVNEQLIRDIFENLKVGVVESHGFGSRTYFQDHGEAATVVAGDLHGALLQINYGRTTGFPCLHIQAFGYEDFAQEALYPRRLVERLREAFSSEEDGKLALEEKVQKGYAYGPSWREVFDLGRIGERKDVII